jgi:hypothetical protein
MLDGLIEDLAVACVTSVRVSLEKLALIGAVARFGFDSLGCSEADLLLLFVDLECSDTVQFHFGAAFLSSGTVDCAVNGSGSKGLKELTLDPEKNVIEKIAHKAHNNTF